MRIFTCAIAVLALTLASTQDVLADAESGQGYFTGMASYVDDDKKRELDDGLNGFQIGMGYAMNQNWNVEGFLSMASPDATDTEMGMDQEHFSFGVDLQRVFMRDERFSPYLLAGVGHFSSATQDRNDSGIMYAAGAGFYLDLFSSNVSLRGEFKRRRDSAEAVNHFDNLFSLGVQVPFGSGTPKWTDSDGDGVEDGSDNCPNTPAGASVDAFGCELDSDGDGVKDSMDQCPGTPRGVSVDATGCPNDTDGDGVTDDMDQCPNTMAGVEVDAKGCERDDDKDGVVNRLDECPGTPEGTPVDRRGCTIEGDYILRGVNFESNSDRVVSGTDSILDGVTETLLKYPEIRFVIEGHTDSDGAAEYNLGLSTRRAQTVYDYLAANGVAEDRMSVKGYGESQPMADNSTAAGKAQNRRVVLSVIED
jgi:OOP family OmpA-OmpF porin